MGTLTNSSARAIGRPACDETADSTAPHYGDRHGDEPSRGEKLCRMLRAYLLSACFAAVCIQVALLLCCACVPALLRHYDPNAFRMPAGAAIVVAIFAIRLLAYLAFRAALRDGFIRRRASSHRMLEIAPACQDRLLVELHLCFQQRPFFHA